MKKMRWISWALSIAMLATPCASFAQEVSTGSNVGNDNVASETQKSESNVATEENSKVNAENSVETDRDKTELANPENSASVAQGTEAKKSADGEESAERKTTSENKVSTQTESEEAGWTTADFTYGDYSKLMYGCDYKRQFYVEGKVITGFSAQGEEKLKGNKDLVIPAKDPDGNKIVGIGESAFREKGLESVQFPTGMLASYDDDVTTDLEEKVSRRGNFVIGESSFYKNNLKEVTLPNGVISVLSKAFECNQITKVKIPKTIWWIENEAFAENKITDVQFPVTTDFMLELHGMPFACNQIKSVRLPDFTEVVNKYAFAYNPGMEKSPSKTPWGQEVKPTYTRHDVTYTAGVVYMYTDNPDLRNKLQNRLHSIEGENTNIYSPYQRLVVSDGTEGTANPDTSLWNAKDFQYDGGTITGLSESGTAKRRINKDLVIPSKSPDGTTVTEIGSTDSLTGLFATEEEKFDSVYLPNTIRKVGDRAFYNSGLKDITFSNKLNTIGMMAFSTNEISSVILPDSVTDLGKGAFSTNSNIERIVLPKKLRVISDAAFGCSDKYHYMTNLTDIDIPDSVVSIGSRAFAGNNFHHIDIPDSVQDIGEYAFSTKNYLSDPCTVTLREGLQTIGDNAFRNKVITEIDIPTTVQGLALNTFRKEYTSDGHKVDGITTKVYLRNAKQYYDKTNFPDPTGSSTFHRLYLIDPEYWTSDDYTYEKTEGENLVTGFSDLGKRKVKENTEITLPEKDADGNAVTGVATGAFEGKELTGVTIPDTDEYALGAKAFQGNNIQRVTLGRGVTIIGASAFQSNKLAEVSIPATVTQIGKSAFEGNQLTDVTMEDNGSNASELQSRCFAGNQIKSLEIPENTSVMKGDAFTANTGNEPVTEGTEEEKSGGIVYVYKEGTAGSGLEDINSGSSRVQKLIQGSIPAEDAPWDGRHFTYNVAGNVITGLSAAGKEKLKITSTLIVPDRINGVRVTAIGEGTEGFGAFGFQESGKTYAPTSVSLPESVTAIGANAFDGKNLGDAKLTRIEFSKHLEFIGDYAFRDAGLKRVSLPSSVKSLGTGAFAASEKTAGTLENLTLSRGLKIISKDTFANQHLKKIVIPEGITEIQEGAFQNSYTEEISLPDSLQVIGERAFQNHQLQTLTIPDSVTTVESEAFAYTDSDQRYTLESLKMGGALETIGQRAFAGNKLAEFVLPESVKVLPENAFTGENKNITGWTSSEKQLRGESPYEKVTAKGDNYQLKYDKLVGSGWEYSDFKFSEDGKTVLGWTDSGQTKRMKNHHLVIPDKASPDATAYITAIGEGAFAIPLSEVTIGKYDATSPYGLQSVDFPKYLERIEKSAFEYNNLRNFDEKGNQVDEPTDSTGEIPFLKDLQYLTYIGEGAFHGNHLCNVYVPDTVTDMGDGAFAMNNIYKLHISTGMTVIPAGAFSMNIRMSSVTIPEGITEIGQTAFAGARLKSLHIPSTVTRIGRKAFHLHQMKSLVIPGNVKEVGESAFEGTYKAASLESLTIEKGVESIGDRAFKEGHLSTVVLPDSVKSIGKNAFQNNTGNTRISGHPVLVLTNNASLLKANSSSENFRVVLRNLAKNGVQVSSIKNKTYTGKTQTQSITLRLLGMTLRNGSEYKVSYSGNKAVGTAKVIITGIGNYSGSITKTFKINPKGTALTKVKKGKKSFTAYWKKTSKTYTTGYQVQYSRSKKFTKAKTKTVTSYKKKSKKVTKLSKKKTYYVRIRTYKTVKGKRYYSAWSKYKKVKTK